MKMILMAVQSNIHDFLEIHRLMKLTFLYYNPQKYMYVHPNLKKKRFTSIHHCSY